MEILKSLEDLGFKSSAVEPCLFHWTWRNMQYLVGLYVADIIVSGGTESDNEALSRLIDIEYPGQRHHASTAARQASRTDTSRTSREG